MFTSYLEVEKKVPSYFEPDKPLLQLFGERKSGSLQFGEVVHNCQEQGKRL